MEERSTYIDAEDKRRSGLLIESDCLNRAVLTTCLQFAGCGVAHTDTPTTALSQLERREFDLILWRVREADFDLRGQLLFEIRLRTQAPLIVIDHDDAAQMDLESGADQWLPDRLPPGPVVGAIKSALRRVASYPAPITGQIKHHGISLDGVRRSVGFGGATVLLTRQEWELLSIFVSRVDRFLTASEIVRLGWRAGDHETEQVRTYVRRLRLKLKPLALPCELVSEQGRGYSLTFRQAGAQPSNQEAQPASFWAAICRALSARAADGAYARPSSQLLHRQNMEAWQIS